MSKAEEAGSGDRKLLNSFKQGGHMMWSGLYKDLLNGGSLAELKGRKLEARKSAGRQD